jgi:Fe(3+) dicitrate transport protein
VIGRTEKALEHIPGAATVVTREQMDELAVSSAEDALRTVPGVNVVTEDGIGLRPNIGFRGLSPNRSSRVLMLEDGIPISLNPYGEPEMYVTAPIERMERIEVVKGSGSILFGPQTIGGVVNYVTKDPPKELTATSELRYGNFGYMMGQVGVGNTHGQVGYQLDVIHRRFEGHRRLDAVMTDVHGKLRFDIDDTTFIGLKLNYYDESSGQTYVGLTSAQFDADPSQNHALHDQLIANRFAAGATLNKIFGEGLLFQTTVYTNSTTRNWRRQDFDRVRNPDREYDRIVGPGGGEIGASDDGDSLFFRNSTGNRNRSYTVAGIEPRVTWDYELAGMDSELVAGLRLHYEQAREQRLDGSAANLSTGTLREHEVRDGIALAGYIQNRITIGERLRVTPGLRMEQLWGQRNILRTANADVNRNLYNDVFALIPGVGVSYDVASPLTLFAGVHRGFAPPRTKDFAAGEGQNVELEAELSWNYEAGGRVRLGRAFYAEMTGFAMHFQNQIVPPTQAGGATGFQGELWNAGETLNAGVESSVTFDPSALTGWSFRLPLRVSHTWIPIARYLQEGPHQGNRLPYAPEQMLFAQLGVVLPNGFSANVSGNYLGSQFADPGNTVAATADGRVGLIPGRFIMDARVGYTHRPTNLTMFVAGRNLTDERFIISRFPDGIQPGLFRHVFTGVQGRL